jgi:tetratricopeptide (TPR) repeat protein
MSNLHTGARLYFQKLRASPVPISAMTISAHYSVTCVLIHAVAHLNLAQLLERRGHYEEAVSLYRRCSRLNGAGLKDPRTHEATKISALLHLGRLYADQGRLHKAVSMYQEAVDKMPGHYPPQVLIQFDSN